LSESVFVLVLDLIARFLRRCSGAVGFGFGAVSGSTVGVAIGSATATCVVAAVAGVVSGDALGVGAAKIGAVAVVADQLFAVDLCMKYWATPEVTATAIDTSPTAIAQLARRCVRLCRASACLKSISLRISVSRSDAVKLSFEGRVESDWISEK
jgi:hypothetical protein